MSVTHQLHLLLRPVNAALTFWRDGDRFRREARASDGRGFGRLGRSDAGVVGKCELIDDEPLKRMRHVLTTRRPCNRSCRQLAFDDHHTTIHNLRIMDESIRHTLVCSGTMIGCSR